MDKQSRDKLKHDKFVVEVGHTVHYLQDHKASVRKYGGAAAAVIILVVVVWGFLNWRETKRRQDLRTATLYMDGFVGEQPPPGIVHVFKTQAEKDAAVQKAFSEVSTKDSGSLEGQIARYFAGTTLCDQGKVPECEAALRDAMNGSSANVSSIAKLSLITLYHSQNKMTEAEALARQLVDKPTAMVSREQAQILLAKSILRSKPQEAKILLETLMTIDRPSVTRQVVALQGEMMGIQMPRR